MNDIKSEMVETIIRSMRRRGRWHVVEPGIVRSDDNMTMDPCRGFIVRRDGTIQHVIENVVYCDYEVKADSDQADKIAEIIDNWDDRFLRGSADGPHVAEMYNTAEIIACGHAEKQALDYRPRDPGSMEARARQVDANKRKALKDVRNLRIKNWFKNLIGWSH